MNDWGNVILNMIGVGRSAPWTRDTLIENVKGAHGDKIAKAVCVKRSSLFFDLERDKHQGTGEQTHEVPQRMSPAVLAVGCARSKSKMVTVGLPAVEPTA